MPGHALLAALPVAVLVAAHLLAGRLRGLAGRHERAVVSVAGGISVAYVFLHLLPEVAAAPPGGGRVPGAPARAAAPPGACRRLAPRRGAGLPGNGRG